MHGAPRVISAFVGMGVAGLWLAAPALGAEPAPDHVRIIHKATNPSEAIAAYAEGLASNRKDVRLHQAYLRRMVDMGLADMLERQGLRRWSRSRLRRRQAEEGQVRKHPSSVPPASIA